MYISYISCNISYMHIIYHALYHTCHAIIYMLMNACYFRKWQFYTLALSTVSILVCNYKLYINTFKCFIIYHFFKTYPASPHKISIVVKQNRNTKLFRWNMLWQSFLGIDTEDNQALLRAPLIRYFSAIMILSTLTTL